MSNRVEVITRYNKDIITQETIETRVRDVLRDRVEHTMDLRENGVREALIKLGWTPPEGKPKIEMTKEPPKNWRRLLLHG